MSNKKLLITLLADEWNSTKGGLSTMNRELAIQLAKHPNVIVMFFVPKCTEEDKKAASKHNIRIVEATERPGYDPLDWLSFPPRDLVTDVIIGHGVKLGRQAQVIRDYHDCSCWLQVVHTAPEELAMFKNYSGAISKGDEKQWAEVKLCTIADLVVAVGPKLYDIYSRYLSRSEKKVVNLTPGIFTELSDLKQFTQGSKKFRVLVFGRGDSEDFELKGFDIAAKAVAELNDKSYQLVFVGAHSGKGEQVAEKLLEQGLNRSQLTVKGYLEHREDLATLLSTANLAVIPSRTEGFGLTALEALSAGLPFLVSQNSGFGEALDEIPSALSWIIDSEDPEEWAQAIKGVREKGRETAVKECRELRTLYAEMYSWEKQCNELVETILRLVNDKLETSNSEGPRPSEGARPKGSPPSSIDRTELKGKLQTSNSGGPRPSPRPSQGARAKGSPPCSIDRTELKDNLQTSNRDQGARPKQSPHSSIDSTKLKDLRSFSRPNFDEQTRDDHSFGSTTRTSMVSIDRGYGGKSKEFPSASADRAKVIELAILGCNLSSDSMQAVMQVCENIRLKLNLAPNPPSMQIAPLEAKQYLMENRLKFCVLAVDSETIRDAYEKLPQRRREYEGLLETAADEVDKKVIILRCGTWAFKSEKDETAVLQTIERIINKKGKGILARLENGCMSVEPDVLVQCLMSTSPAPRPNPQKEKNGDAPAAAGESYSGQSQTRSECKPGHGYSAQNMLQSVLLRSLLRYGIISEKLEDLQLWTPGFTVPEYISESLLQKHRATPVTGVTITLEKNGELKCSVNPKLIEISQSRYEGIQIAAHETLMLKTRIRNGLVSFQESDVHFRYGNWEIPQDIREGLEAEYRSTTCGDLFIISDEKQTLRSIVKIGKLKKMITFVNKKFNA